MEEWWFITNMDYAEKSSFIANAFVNGMANKYTESSRSRPQLWLRNPNEWN